MRDAGPLPMLRMYAVFSSMASISRKSSGSEVTGNFFQVSPPSSVRSTVLPEPLAQATRALTALTPRRRAFTPLFCTVHWGAIRIDNAISVIRVVIPQTQNELLKRKGQYHPRQRMGSGSRAVNLTNVEIH